MWSAVTSWSHARVAPRLPRNPNNGKQTPYTRSHVALTAPRKETKIPKVHANSHSHVLRTGADCALGATPLGREYFLPPSPDVGATGKGRREGCRGEEKEPEDGRRALVRSPPCPSTVDGSSSSPPLTLARPSGARSCGMPPPSPTTAGQWTTGGGGAMRQCHQRRRPPGRPGPPCRGGRPLLTPRTAHRRVRHSA